MAGYNTFPNRNSGPPPPYQDYQPRSQRQANRGSWSRRYSVDHVSNEQAPLYQTARPLGTTKYNVVSYMLVILVIFVLAPLALYNRFRDDITDPDVRDRIRREWQIEVEGHYNQISSLKGQEGNLQAVIGRQEEEIDSQTKQISQLVARETELLKSIEDHKRQQAEDLERERKARQQMKLYWTDVSPAGQCLRHGARMYAGRLANLDDSIDKIRACKETPITINERAWSTPDHCEMRGDEIYGHWTIDAGESACATYWDSFKDKGCLSGTGNRRFESPLRGVRPQDNNHIEEMCMTTPAKLLDQSFSGPVACPDWGKYGYWGIWDVPDSNCY